VDYPAVLHEVHDIETGDALSFANVDIAAGGDGFAVVWELAAAWIPHIILQRLSAEGEPLGEPIVVGEGSTPRVIWANGEWVVAWRSSESRVVGQRIAPDGTFIHDQVFLSHAGYSVGSRAVALEWIPGRGYVVVYGINTSAHLRFVGETLDQPEPPIAIPSTSNSYTTPRTAVGPDGTLGIIYSRVSGGVGFITYSEAAGFGSMVALSTSGGTDDMDLAHDGVTWVAAVAASGQTHALRGPSLQQSTRLDNHANSVGRARLDSGDGYLYAAWMAYSSPNRAEIARLEVPADPSAPVIVLNPVTARDKPSLTELESVYREGGRQLVVTRQSSNLRAFTAEYPGCP
jgi:hypothetical protein